MNLTEILALAASHIEYEISGPARMALVDAHVLLNNGRLKCARQKALESLLYSIGFDHPDYQLASGYHM